MYFNSDRLLVESKLANEPTPQRPINGCELNNLISLLYIRHIEQTIEINVYLKESTYSCRFQNKMACQKLLASDILWKLAQCYLKSKFVPKQSF